MPREGLRPRKAIVGLGISGLGERDDFMNNNVPQKPEKTVATNDVAGGVGPDKAKSPEEPEAGGAVDARPAKRRRGKKGQSITTKSTAEAKAPRPEKTKKNPYGLTPGLSPFPEFPGPTAADCEEDVHLLTELHGEILPPDQDPEPSLEITGCGEVPSVLDAMIRTLLSAHTSANTSALAFKGLVKRFGTIDNGAGKGSVDWQKVYRASAGDVTDSIKGGGLGGIKGQHIKKILDKVYEVSIARRQQPLLVLESNQGDSKVGLKAETDDKKDTTDTTDTTDDVELSLEDIRDMEPELAMLEMTNFSGIGVKTAACVLLFCLQKPCFADDTHVWRICRWLKWAPMTATRDQVFSHCEVHIPAHLKYTLHQLFVRHGRECKRCNAMKTTDDTELPPCPIDHLLERTQTERGRKKGPGTEKDKKGKMDKEAKYDGGDEKEDNGGGEEKDALGGGDDPAEDGVEDDGGEDAAEEDA